MSATFLTAPVHHLRLSARPAAKAIGMMLYGDESRTRATLFFGFACVGLYTVAFSRMVLCSLG